MEKKELAGKILDILKEKYPGPKTKLVWKNPWELLVATILAAQCTDDRVNKVTPTFFKKWPDIRSLAQADLQEVEKVVYSTGFYKNKAKNLINSAKIILINFGGKVPSTMKELTSLPGVARKTANIVLSNCFTKNEGIAVDTHVKRLSNRFGLTSSHNPVIIERDLMEIFDQKDWHLVNHLFVWFGRDVCKSRNPQCENCELFSICPRIGISKQLN